MALHPGDHIAHYELTSLLGAGGMGEVYRATDTRLRREVAIKVLPDGLAHDRDRLERFQREATILASLNHPHIAQVYGLEQVRDSVALVMELIEGDELSRRIGRISIAEAIGIAAQIASALDAAHAAGVIHRDLKPANVMIRDDGSVRILDFGLAKVEHSAASPTITDAGTVLGTIAYMAPEQARGKAVDKRSDIWAFGCVLFEMLAGTRAFPGESASDTVAGVLEREPDWSALPASVPPSLGVLLRKCLQKDRANRLRDIGDALFDLAQAQLPPSAGPESRAAPSSRAREYAAWAIAAAAVIGLIVMATSEFRSDDQAPPVVRFAVQPPQGRSFGPMAVPHAALSPSGTHLAFVSNTDGSEPTLWVRALDDPEPRELPGTRGAANPFWSPDGQSLAFVAAGRLLRTDLSGAGTPQMIAKLPLGLEGGDWSESNSILFGTGSAGIFRVPAGGGEPIVVTTRQVGEPSHHWPSWLPGDRFLYRAANGQVFVASLAGTDARPLLKSDAKVAFVPPATLLFVRGEELMAQTFHPDRGVLEGSPRRVIEQLRLGNVGRAGFSASRTNALMYSSSRGRAQCRDASARRPGASDTPAAVRPDQDVRVVS